ncbi:hypothetical protein FOMA001_g19722 [Fusarium oxysporum f. sp. matthiolae]|nr:hypothetical protein FOMA001_g19722 [Fusarium oxysporum f. sp. matthiolae]
MGGPRQVEEWVVAEREAALQICEAEFAVRRLVSSRNMTLEAVEQALGVTCNQGYFKITDEMAEPEHKTKWIYQSGSMDQVHVMSDRSTGKVSAATRWGICVASRLPVSRLQYKGAVEEPPSEYGKHPKKRFSTSRAHNQGIDSRKARKGEYRAGVLRIPAIWYMLNPNDITNPIKLKLTACRTRETEEAEKFLGLDQAYKRARLAISDSVSLAIFFHRKVSMCFEHYVNVGEESVFVLVSQYNVAVETNERGALHLHGLLWLQGNMHPSTLSRDV